jgi:tripartite-type tricarboxylate transporter receptor subunit TctC
MSMLGSRRNLLLSAAAALLPGAMAKGAAEAVVTLVVPFSAGGSADLSARALAAHLPALLPGRTRIVVEHRAGASGAVGTASVARAAPDGQTLLLARGGSSAILPATDGRTPFAWDDFTFLGLLEQSAYAIAVRAEAPWADLAALVAALRDAPGQMRFATSGPATILDLGVRQLFIAAGLELDAATAVVLRGGGEQCFHAACHMHWHRYGRNHTPLPQPLGAPRSATAPPPPPPPAVGGAAAAAPPPWCSRHRASAP